jgi:hypothetical protein
MTKESIMSDFRAFDQRVELRGSHLIAMVEAFPTGTEKVGKAILKAKGFEDPEPDQWYSLQNVLDVLKGLYDAFDPHILTQMGYRLAAIVDLPAHWDTIDIAFRELDAGYQMNHRGGEIGSYNCQDLGTQSGLRRLKMISKSHWPCELDRGLMHGMGDRYKKDGMDVLVRRNEGRALQK